MKKSYDEGQVFDLIQDLTQTLLKWSWEGVLGIENRIQGVARAYGHEAQVVMSAEAAEVRIGSRAALLTGFPGIPPLAALPKLKALLKEVANGAIDPVEARIQLGKISETRGVYSGWLRILGVSLISFGFSIDIIGTWEACIVGLLTGLIAGCFLLWSERSLRNGLVVPLVAAFAVAACVMLASRFGITVAPAGLLMIPAMFVFIPGDSISMQALEIADGHWTAGTARLAYSVVMLVLMASGVVLAAAVTGTDYSAVSPGVEGTNVFPWWAPYPGHIVFTIGTALAFQMRWKDVYMATIITLIVTGVAQLGSMAFGGFVGTFFASVAMVILAVWASSAPHRSPAYVFILTPLFCLTPGSHGLRAFESWFAGQQAIFTGEISALFGNLVAIAIGIAIGMMMTSASRRTHHQY